MAGAEPLWRAIAVYRFASIGYAVLLVVINRADYSRPGWAWVVIAVMTAWTAATMLETFGWFRGEGFGLIVEDLLRLPDQPGVIAEGFRLLPRLVQPLLAVPGRAAWLCPTPGFRRAALASRGSLHEIAGKTSDPEKALRNLLDRDRMFTERLWAEATALGLRVIEVNATMTEDDLAGQVTQAFGL